MTVPTLCMVCFMFLVWVLVLKSENNDLKEEVDKLKSIIEHHKTRTTTGMASGTVLRTHDGESAETRHAMHIIRNK